MERTMPWEHWKEFNYTPFVMCPFCHCLVPKHHELEHLQASHEERLP